MRVAKKFLLVLLLIAISYLSTNLYKQTKPQPLPTVKLHLSQDLLNKVENKYGIDARQRFVEWKKLMETQNLTDLEKIRLVNDFFNQNSLFVNDAILWLKEDYWATPMEFLAKGAGDCEDFSIAKYFTLLEMGLNDSKLRITYVKAVQINQPHMVLTYFESPQAVPLVLDNLNPNIIPATERNDLEPVYSFNGQGLWLAKIKGSGKQVGTASKLNPWSDLKRRMLESAL